MAHYQYANDYMVVFEDVYDTAGTEALIVSHNEKDDADQRIDVINYGFMFQKKGASNPKSIDFTLSDESGNLLKFKRIQDGEYEYDAKGTVGNQTSLNTSSSGLIIVNGLLPGKYILTEKNTGLFSNTVLLKDPILITISDGSDGQLGKVTIESANSNDSKKDISANIQDNLVSFIIQNEAMPNGFLETGGEGNTMYYMIAGGIIAAMVVIFGTKRILIKK